MLDHLEGNVEETKREAVAGIIIELGPSVSLFFVSFFLLGYESVITMMELDTKTNLRTNEQS